MSRTSTAQGRPLPRTRGLRSRLLIYSATAISIALLLSGAITHLLMERQLVTSLDESLHKELEEIETLATDNPSADRLAEASVSYISVESSARPEMHIVIDIPGRSRLISRSVPSEEVGLDQTKASGEISALTRYADELMTSEGRSRLTTADDVPGSPVDALTRELDVGGAQLRVASELLTLSEGQPAVISVAVGLGQVRNTLRQLDLTMLLGAVLALALTALAGMLWTRRALVPIRNVIATARSVSREDLSGRISEGPAGDELGELVTAMNEMLARLEDAFNEQSRFLSDASHELRTPLTIIRGNLELLADPVKNRLDDEARARCIELALDELMRMGRLVDNLLLIARAKEAGFLTFTTVETEVLLREIMDKAAALSQRRVDFKTQLPAGHRMRLDVDRMTQILMNLIRNAVNHTVDNERIEVSARMDKGGLAITVADDGPGISEADAPLIFTRLFRGTDPFGRRRGGAGLGLPIAKALAEAHGGSLELLRPGDSGTGGSGGTSSSGDTSSSRGAAGAEGPPLKGAIFELRIPAETTEKGGKD